MSRNLNWSDSKVFGVGQQQANASNAGVMGFSYEKPKQQVSPATYADPKTQNAGVAGAQYSDPNAGVAGAQYADPNKNAGVAGAGYQDPNNTYQGVAGATTGMPSGQPAYQTPAQTAPLSVTTTPMVEQGPPPVTSPLYVPGYLKSLIGQAVRAEFLVGSNVLTDRTGIIREVGVNYFVLENIVTRSRVMCDLYAVKFVTSL